MSGSDLFYQGSDLHADIYDALTAQGFGAHSADVEFYLRHAEQTGSPVLELGAGTGRITWALAQAGFAVVGLDMSERMLQRAEAKGATLAAPVRQRACLLQGDMANFRLDQTFRLVVIPYRSFQMLPSSQRQRDCLTCVHHHLEQGGRLIVDLFDPRLDLCMPGAPCPNPHQSVIHPVSGNTVKVDVVRLKSDPVAQLITERWRFSEITQTGEVIRQEEEVLTVRWIYRYEMRYLFELTGFDVEGEFSNFHDAPRAYGQEQVWVVRKP